MGPNVIAESIMAKRMTAETFPRSACSVKQIGSSRPTLARPNRQRRSGNRPPVVAGNGKSSREGAFSIKLKIAGTTHEISPLSWFSVGVCRSLVMAMRRSHTFS
jgi:hypothetical protein